MTHTRFDTSNSDSPRSFLRFTGRVLRDWKLILATAIAAILVAAVASALRPEVFTARIVLFLSPSKSDSGLQAFSSQLPAGLPGISTGVNPTARLIGVVLNSRTLSDTIAARAGSARGRQILNNMDGSIVIDITDTDPRQAARVANAFPDAINHMIARIELQSMLLKQEFLNQQLAEARGRTEEAERKLVQFQQNRNAGDVEEQASRTVDAVVQLQRTISETELEVSQLRRTATADNPQFRAAVAELDARREQLRRLMAEGSANRVFVPLSESPELRAGAARLLREFREAEQIYISLAAALAEARITGNNNLPVVNVLDPALVPTQPSSTPSVVIIGMAAVAGLLVGLALALFRSYAHFARLQPENADIFVAWDQFKAERFGRARRRSSVP
ncbi:MAG: hypothetical protein M3418_07640 [Gemmatimonadota bacterium]|nr:hypothetical protein [Gemmatimonadota bacterium]